MIRKEIPNYEGIYEISDCGKIFSLASGKALSPTRHKDGYLLIGLSKNSDRKFFSVHRLAALTFFGEDSRHVNHKNGIKDDNRLENLEYVTPKENMSHAVESGLHRVGSASYSSKLTENQVLEIFTDKKSSNMALARKYSVTDKAIRDIRQGKTWKHLTKPTTKLRKAK
jgi:hypothetical protein